MTSTIRNYTIALITVGLIAACGGSGSDQQTNQQQTKQQKKQARQDSVAQAKADSVKRAKADSIAKAQKQQESKDQKQKKKDKLTLKDISFSASGAFSVQVGAWRSKHKAEEQISTWKQRGFSNAYVVKYGNEKTGDIWFRVRVGKVENRAMAEKLSDLLMKKYDEKSWISTTKSTS